MRVFILLLFMVVLGGCGVVQSYQLKSAFEKANVQTDNECSPLIKMSAKEKRAWDLARQKIKTCAFGVSVPYPKESIVQMGNCSDKIVEEMVMPVAYSKQRLKKAIKGKKKTRNMYVEGEIDSYDFERRIKGYFLKYFEEGKFGSYYRYASCHSDILNREVLPLYPNVLKPNFVDYSSELLSLSRKADKSKMEEEDYFIATRKLWSKFAAKEQEIMAPYQAQQSDTWRQIGKTILDMENKRLEEARKNIPQSTSTNCNMVGRTMHCTTR